MAEFWGAVTPQDHFINNTAKNSVAKQRGTIGAVIFADLVGCFGTQP